MDCVTKAAEQWNKIADSHNQWTELGQDEKDTLILRQLVREFVDCYFERNHRPIKEVVEDACTVLVNES